MSFYNAAFNGIRSHQLNTFMLFRVYGASNAIAVHNSFSIKCLKLIHSINRLNADYGASNAPFGSEVGCP